MVIAQPGFDFIGNRLALPPFAQFHRFRSVFIAFEIELVMFPFFERMVIGFIDDPVHGKFRINGSIFGGGRQIPGNQFFIIDMQCLIFQDFPEGIGYLQHGRAFHVFLIGFGHQSQTVQIDIIGSGQELFPQPVDPGERRPVLVMDLIPYPILMIKCFRTGSRRVSEFVFHI